MVKVQRRLERVASPAARRQVGRWLGKGFWAIMDQGLFAVSNFALNILLARWLVPADYGAFSVAYTIFLLLGTFHTAILTEPMLIFGPGRYKERLSAYLAALLRGHWLFGALVGTLFAAAGLALWRFGHSPLTPAIFGLAVASPFILFQWLMRRACYVNLQPRLAAYAGVIYLALMGAGVFGLYSYDRLGAATALLIMAVASLASGLWLVHQLRMDGEPGKGSALARETLRNHMAYGRWSVAAAALSWIPGNILYLILPLRSGLEAVGALRAMMNLIMPILQINAALGVILLPTLVRAREHGSDVLIRSMWIAIALFMVGAGIYGLLIGLFAEPLMGLFYGSRYTEFAPLAWLLGFLPIANGLTSVAGGGLRALERPDSVFWAYAISTAVTLTAGLVSLLLWDIYGAALGIVLASLTTAGVMVLLVVAQLRLLRDTPQIEAVERI